MPTEHYVIRTHLGKEPVGIAKVPIEGHPFTRATNTDDTYLELITEAEYETYRELALFPGYAYRIGLFNEVVIYDPVVYKMKGHRLVKRGKRDERERRKQEKKRIV